MRTTRIYSPSPLLVGQLAELSETAADHVSRVLRLRVGAAVTMFDGRGGEYAAELTAISRQRVLAEVQSHLPVERESPVAVTLLQSLARGEKMDWIVQKATELGVASIAPIETQRCIVSLEGERADRRLEHWRAVAVSACEQCGRNRLPQVLAPRQLEQYLQEPQGEQLQVLLSPTAPQPLAAVAAGCTAAALLIGPEGGLTDLELEMATQRGFVPARLGPRILRTETAAVAAITVLQATSGDMNR